MWVICFIVVEVIMIKWDQKLFEDAVTDVHKDQFSFELTIFTLLSNKVTITCKDHGSFNIVARNLLNGSTCKGCRDSRRLYTDEQLLEMISHKKGSSDLLYDLSQIRCMKSFMTTTCKRSGHVSKPAPFRDHLKSPVACVECKHENTKVFAKKSRKLTYGRVSLQEAQARHPGVVFIDYVSANNFKTPCTVCKTVHPCQLKRLAKTNNSYRCTTCSTDAKDLGYDVMTKRYTEVHKKKHQYSNVYIIMLQSDSETYYKVGISTDVARRLRHILASAKNYYTGFLLASFKLDIDSTCRLEAYLHTVLKPYRVKPVVKFSGSSSECFSNIDGILDHIPFDQVEVITNNLKEVKYENDKVACTA